MGVLEKDCGPRCRSRQHARQLVTAVSKGNPRQIQLFLSKCHNPASIFDQHGRTVLHVAASCGKWQVLDWLINERGAELTPKDLESHWTALHRALFYGQLTSARLLISHGASMCIRDREGLTPLDIVMKDRLPHVEFIQSGLNEVYTWGDNSNFTLGHGNEQHRRYPEAIEVFRKQAISIKQIVMCKYHTVFLSTAGKVYTCGHGRGGRLGHSSEITCLEPKLVTALKDEVCVQVAGSSDHTVMLMESGVIYSCGLNDCLQLGHVPPQPVSLMPKLMNHKQMKGKVITGVLAQRFHTVLYNKDSVFTFGLNAGQLGHQKAPGEVIISYPRQVSALIHKDMSVKLVTSCDAATVVVTNRGDVYALHEYQCRRIVSKRLDIEQVSAYGGRLDSKVDFDGIKEHVERDLVVAIRTTSGKIYMWKSGEPSLKRCAWVLRRPLFITDMTLGANSLAFITKDGEAFIAALPKQKNKDVLHSNVKEVCAGSPPAAGFSLTLTDLVDRDEAVDVSVERVPLIHRAINIVGDQKSRNFAVLQAQANASLTEIPSVQDSVICKHFEQLLNEADTMDNIHDVILKVGLTMIPAHRYILAQGSEYFHKVFLQPKDDFSNDDTSGISTVEVENVQPEILNQLLKYIYTGNCDMLTAGKHFVLASSRSEPEDVEPSLNGSFVPYGQMISAYEVHHINKKKNKKKEKNTKEKKTRNNKKEKDPVQLLQDVARRFGVKSLMKKLEAVRYSEGLIENIPGRHITISKLKLNRTKESHLYDVCIASEDGRTIQCHKCVLVARLEYFRSMLASGWIETSNTKSLSLPVPGDILQVIVDYLYTDDSSVIKDCVDVEFLCNVMVLADQLLVERLGDMCQVALASLINLKNACELLEFASTYNAKQLKVTCQQFIVINLAALLETRSLDVLSDDVIEELSEYYKDQIRGMYRRRITPYEGWPDVDYLEKLESEYKDLDLSEACTANREDHSTRRTKGKKKRTRTKSSGDDAQDRQISGESSQQQVTGKTERQCSVSSDTSFILELDDIEESETNQSHIEKAQDVPLSPSSYPSEVSSKIRVRIPAMLAASSTSSQPEHKYTILQPHRGDAQLSAAVISAAVVNAESQPSVVPSIHQPSVALREIMAQQEETDKNQSKVISQINTKKTGRLSQKERKRLAAKINVSPTSPDLTRSIDKATASSEGAKPKTWSTPTKSWDVLNTNQVTQSFKDLMLSEEAVPPSKPTPTFADDERLSGLRKKPAVSSDADTTVSWGLKIPSTRKKSDVSQLGTSPESPHGSSSADNPWLRTTSTSVSSQALSFTDIMMDEIQQKETLDRVTNKPLALIQIEEQAIQELREYYKADSTFDEYITVERVHTAQATPTWAATQRHKTC